MSNKFSFWDGQPVTAPVYPQMGDIQQMHPRFAGGYGGAGQWPGSAASSYGAAMHQQAARYSAGGGGGMPMHMQGMGDFRQQMVCPHSMPTTSSFFGPPQGQFEPVIDNCEAYCAYNGMDTSIQGGGAMAGRGGGGANGDFW